MRKAAGYTIVEVLMAIIILAIAIPGLSVFVLGSRKAQVGNVRFENAAAFAQKVYDDLMMLPPARVGSSGTSQRTIDGQLYEASWTKTTFAAGGSKVGITVQWKVGGKTHSSTLNGVLP